MRLLLFDIDGTLIAAKGAGRRALERALEVHYGLEAGLKEVPLDGKTDPLIVREALQMRGLPFCGLNSDFVATYLNCLRRELRNCPDFAVIRGVVELMGALDADSNLLLGLATGNVQPGASLKIERAGLAKHFRFGGYGCDAEDRTEVIRTAVRRGRKIALRPVRDVIVIGDTPRDIQHGKMAGARVVAVATGSYGKDALDRYRPELTLSSLFPTQEVLDFFRSG